MSYLLTYVKAHDYVAINDQQKYIMYIEWLDIQLSECSMLIEDITIK